MEILVDPSQSNPDWAIRSGPVRVLPIRLLYLPVLFSSSVLLNGIRSKVVFFSRMQKLYILRASVTRFVRLITTTTSVMSEGSDTARRIVFRGNNVDPCLIEEVVSIPKLKAGEILGKFRMATICGSDLHTISGRRKEAVPRFVY